MLAIAGDIDVRSRLRATNTEYVDVVHLDGQNLFPYLRGDDTVGPRGSNIYFGHEGEVTALRVGDWKCVFDPARRERPFFRDLRGDPFERDVAAAMSDDQWREQDALGALGHAVLSDFAEVLTAFPPPALTTVTSVQTAMERMNATAAPQH
jgi:hypothetical protein